MKSRAALRDVMSMDAALEADGEKLRQLTGEDHGPFETVAQAIGEFDPADQDFNGDISEAMAAATVDPDFIDDLPDPNDPKTLVKRTRSGLQGILNRLTVDKAAAEQRIAAANARCDERNKAAITAFEAEKVAALAEHVAALADAEGDLQQLAACREAIDLAVGRLNKA